MNTLALDENWDLAIVDGTLTVFTGGASLAQDVACAVKTFFGEPWYNRVLGVPYYQQILGYRPSLQFMKQAFVTAGMIVPNVASITCYLTGPGPGRNLGGQLQITSTNGQISVAQTGNLFGQSQWWVTGAIGAGGAVGNPWGGQFNTQFGAP